MKNRSIIFSLLSFIGCSNGYDYEQSKLYKQNLMYENLPSEIHDFFKNPSLYSENIITDPLGGIKLVWLDEQNLYSLKSIKTFVGPWVAYEKLIDLKNGISYRLEQGNPHPFIINENKLYFPNVYNLMIGSKEYNGVEFTCCTLPLPRAKQK